MGSTDNKAKLNENDSEEDLKTRVQQSDESSVESSSGARPKTTVASAAGTEISVSENSVRPRHDSTSSSDSTRSPSTDRLKRRRTTSSSSPLTSFIFPALLHPNLSPGYPLHGSPSPLSSSPSGLPFAFPFSSDKKMVATASSPVGSVPLSLDEVMNAVNGVTNMALAHEIALDANFKLEKFEPPSNSLSKHVKDIVHEAYWDNLRDQLGKKPPVYTQAFVLLQDVRDQLLELTLSHQERLRHEIKDKLDVELIKQQAEHGVLDFAGYSSYVLGLMRKLCAPVRDEAIDQLKQVTDVVEVFRGVVETLDLMRLDMANYRIQMIRPTIVNRIVDYERTKFKEFLKTQHDGLELTRAWILKHVDSCWSELRAKAEGSDASSTAASKSLEGLLTDPLSLRSFCNKVVNSAFMELLQWPEQKILPETTCVDSERILEQRDRLHQLCLLASVKLVAVSTVVSNRPALAADELLRQRLKKDLCPILDPAFTQAETLAALPNLIEAVVASVQSYLGERSLPTLDDATISSLRQQLQGLNDSTHRVTNLVTTRCLAFIASVLNKSCPRNTAIPTPFLLLQEEVARICVAFLRFTQHNRDVFGEFYFDMTESKLKELQKGQKNASSDSSKDNKVIDTKVLDATSDPSKDASQVEETFEGGKLEGSKASAHELV